MSAVKKVSSPFEIKAPCKVKIFTNKDYWQLIALKASSDGKTSCAFSFDILAPHHRIAKCHRYGRYIYLLENIGMLG